MAKIDGVQGGWPAQTGEVKELRKAITAHLQQDQVPPVMAPMMGELLARLEDFSAPAEVAPLATPPLPDGEPPPTAGQLQEALEGAVQHLGADGGSMRALQEMGQVIEDHLALKHEVLARCAQ